MEKVKFEDGKQYLLKMDKPSAVYHGKWKVGVYHEDLECFNLNPTIHFQHVSEVHDIDKLVFFKISSTGLYAIDQDPKTVDKEWIEKNAFQLGHSLDTQPISDIMSNAIEKLNAPTVDNQSKEHIEFGDYHQHVLKILKESFGWSHSPDVPFVKSDYDSGKTVIQSCENFGHWNGD